MVQLTSHLPFFLSSQTIHYTLCSDQRPSLSCQRHHHGWTRFEIHNGSTYSGHIELLHFHFSIICTQIFTIIQYLFLSSLNKTQVMWLASIVCISMIQYWANANVMSSEKIWWALAAFMGTQVVTGAMYFQSKTGV